MNNSSNPFSRCFGAQEKKHHLDNQLNESLLRDHNHNANNHQQPAETPPVVVVTGNRKRSNATNRKLSQLLFRKHSIVPRGGSVSSTINAGNTKEQHKDHVLKEFLTSEETYIHCLDLLNSEFIEPIQQQQLVSQRVFDVLFPIDIQIIRNVNKNFYAHLRLIVESSNRDSTDLASTDYNLSFKLDKSKSRPSQLAQLLHYFSQAFRLYIGYISKHSASTQMLRSELDRPNVPLTKFLKKQTKKLKNRGEKAVNINDYMITMVQRIPRYKLLLEDLVRHTDTDDESYSSLLETSSLIATIAKFCNEKEREFKRQSVTFDLQRQISYRVKLPNGTQKEFIHPSRQVLEQYIHGDSESSGQIMIVKRDGNYGPCSLYLFSDSVVFEKKYGIRNQNRAYIQYIRLNTETPYGTVIEVQTSIAWNLEEDGRAFQISTKYLGKENNRENVREFCFVCDSADTCFYLVNMINKQLAANL